MSEIPWWALSPSPMTLIFWCVCAFYGAYQLGSKTKREWIGNFGESAFVLGLVIIVFDSVWQIFQWVKFGYLHPKEFVMVRNVLVRNLAIFCLCALSSWKLNVKVKILNFRNIVFIVVPILSLAIRFLLVSNPVWTDWTYGLRFEVDSPWFIAYLTGIPDRISLALTYVLMWRK